jgi:hypothetical protein
MMPMVSGGNDAFEKSFISVSILSEEAPSRSLLHPGSKAPGSDSCRFREAKDSQDREI